MQSKNKGRYWEAGREGEAERERQRRVREGDVREKGGERRKEAERGREEDGKRGGCRKEEQRQRAGEQGSRESCSLNQEAHKISTWAEVTKRKKPDGGDGFPGQVQSHEDQQPLLFNAFSVNLCFL